MKVKLPMMIAVFLNLLVWNYSASGSWGDGFFSAEYFVVIHIIISSLVVLFLWLLGRKFRRAKGKQNLLLVCLSVLAAYLPPVIALWIAYALPQLISLYFKDTSTPFLEGLFTPLVAAVWVYAMAWYYWVPLGVANYFLLRTYSKVAGSLN